MIRNALIAWRNVRQYRNRTIGLALLTLIGCVVGLTSAGIVAQASSATQHRILESVALRSIELETASNRPDIRPLNGRGLSDVAATPGVERVEPWLQASFGIKNQQIGGVLLYATTPEDSFLPPIVRSTRSQVFPLQAGEVVLPASAMATDLSPLLGTTLSVVYTRKTAEGVGEGASDNIKVVALYDPKYQDDGPSAAYADPALVIRWAAAKAGVPENSFVDTVGYTKALVIVQQASQVPQVLDALRSRGFDGVSLQARLTQLPASVNLLRTLGLIVIGLLIVYCFFSGFLLSGAFVRQRTREIGLLKALGFRRSRVFSIFLLELLVVGLSGSLAGVIAGNLISAGLGFALSGSTILEVTLPGGPAIPDWQWSALLLVAPAIAVLVGGFEPCRRAASMQPDVALRDW